jgi:hypothetical protein
LNIPIDYTTRQSYASIAKNKYRNRDDIDMDQDPYCYIFACVSNITLLRKCLAISKLPIIAALMACERNKDAELFYIHIDLESCMLLHEHGCDLISLLSIAYLLKDYNSQKYIINHMTEIDLFNIIHVDRYKGLINILLMNRIHDLQDNHLKLICNSYIINQYHNPVIKCYYIINYMSIDASKTYILEHNGDRHYVLLTSLLLFHFRPRGSHTKSAMHNT